MEEMKGDHFYEGLNPKYWQILAHKVDGENPAGYFDLLLATQKTGRKSRNQRPSAPKDNCKQWIECYTFSDPRQLIPLMQVEGQPYFHHLSFNHWNAKGEVYSSMKQEGEEEMEPLADEEVKASG